MSTRSSSSGFTLLEIMVAIAILGLTLVVLLGIVTTNVRATNHAKMNTAATFLARSKMVDVEDDILYNGFSTDSESDEGTFREMGYPQFRWETEIERIELPSDLAQKTKDQATDKQQEGDSSNPMSMVTGFLGGMMSTFIDPIRIGLEESVRKVTVRVYWSEIARPEVIGSVTRGVNTLLTLAFDSWTGLSASSLNEAKRARLGWKSPTSSFEGS